MSHDVFQRCNSPELDGYRAPKNIDTSTIFRQVSLRLYALNVAFTVLSHVEIKIVRL